MAHLLTPQFKSIHITGPFAMGDNAHYFDFFINQASFNFEKDFDFEQDFCKTEKGMWVCRFNKNSNLLRLFYEAEIVQTEGVSLLGRPRKCRLQMRATSVLNYRDFLQEAIVCTLNNKCTHPNIDCPRLFTKLTELEIKDGSLFKEHSKPKV